MTRPPSGWEPWYPWGLPGWFHRASEATRMSLKPEQLFSVVRIVGDLSPGSSLTERSVVGTAFVVAVQSEVHGESLVYGYLVTAAHVLERQMHAKAEFPNPLGGLYPAVKLPSDAWRQPLAGVDLAIMKFSVSGAPIWGVSLDDEVLPENQPLLLGDTVLYVGILVPLDRPMVRAGTIGALDQTRLPLEHGDYPAHLIDCRSYDGFSGSPVYREINLPTLNEWRPEWAENLPEGVRLGGNASRTFLAGMFTAHMTPLDGEDGATNRYGVGVMLPVDRIMEAIMDGFADDRAEADAAITAKRDAPKLAGASHTGRAASAEFNAFEELAGKLLQVPKSEIDEERRKA